MSAARLRAIAFASLAGTMAFCYFFFAAKHRPWLADLAPFGEDPYDAVGSFAIQLAGVAAIVSAMRALKDLGSGPVPAVPGLLILRGATVALLAIVVTAVADLVAMARYPMVWTLSPSGRALAVGLATLVVATATAIGLLARAARRADPHVRPARWGRAASILLAGALVLYLYPPVWRLGAAGAIVTALFGMVVMFLQVWALSRSLLSRDLGSYADLLDEVRALLAHVGLESAPAPGPSGGTFPGLRRHPWRAVLLLALGVGIALALGEARGEGPPADAMREWIVLGVFTGLEAAAIVIGYALLSEYLGLVRRDSTLP